MDHLLHQQPNLVIFPVLPDGEDLTIYSTRLSELSYKNRIVGSIESGFLYVDQKTPLKGRYEYHPKFVGWSEIQQVKINWYIHWQGVLFGLVLYFLGFCAFHAGWISKTHEGTGIVVMPLIGAIGGSVLFFGAIRNRIVIWTNSGVFRWVSDPLAYQKTLSICVEATTRCRKHQILVQSHVAEPTG